MASKKLSVKPTEFYSWGIFLQIAEQHCQNLVWTSLLYMDAQQHQIIQPVVRHCRSQVAYHLIMRNVLKLLSQEAVEIGEVHAIVTSLSNSEKASHK
jgi:hypothetical protein